MNGLPWPQSSLQMITALADILTPTPCETLSQNHPAHLFPLTNRNCEMVTILLFYAAKFRDKLLCLSRLLPRDRAELWRGKEGVALV